MMREGVPHLDHKILKNVQKKEKNMLDVFTTAEPSLNLEVFYSNQFWYSEFTVEEIN